jgi:hypothetical protein
MNDNDRDLDHYAQVLALIRSHAAKHARRHMEVSQQLASLFVGLGAAGGSQGLSPIARQS